MQKRVEDLEAQISNYLEERASTTPTFYVVAPKGEGEPHDVFISDAPKDKEDFVDGLAARAREAVCACGTIASPSARGVA